MFFRIAALIAAAIVTAAFGLASPARAGSEPPCYINSSSTGVEDPDSNSNDATAVCRDGTYPHSQHCSGTCSGHHGVAEWLVPDC